MYVFRYDTIFVFISLIPDSKGQQWKKYFAISASVLA